MRGIVTFSVGTCYKLIGTACLQLLLLQLLLLLLLALLFVAKTTRALLCSCQQEKVLTVPVAKRQDRRQHANFVGEERLDAMALKDRGNNVRTVQRAISTASILTAVEYWCLPKVMSRSWRINWKGWRTSYIGSFPTHILGA